MMERGRGRGRGRGRSGGRAARRGGEDDAPVVVTLGVNKLKSGIRQTRRLLTRVSRG